jgi:Leucine-rich repeat (LRR) protein
MFNFMQGAENQLPEPTLAQPLAVAPVEPVEPVAPVEPIEPVAPILALPPVIQNDRYDFLGAPAAPLGAAGHINPVGAAGHIPPVGAAGHIHPLGAAGHIHPVGAQQPPVGAHQPIFSFALTQPQYSNFNHIAYLNSLFRANNIPEIKLETLDAKLLKAVYDIFHNHIIVQTVNPTYLKFVAIYYKITKDLVKMKEFYIKAINHGCTCVHLSNVEGFDFTNMFDKTHLKSLYLNNNMLSVVDEKIYSLVNLVYLDLSNNNFTVISERIGSLKSLTGLNLAHNELTDLPEPLYELTKLQYLVLSNNRLTHLSDSIVKLVCLQKLSICHNKLITFPPDISKISNLKQLDIGYNQLNTFPPSLCDLSFLESLYIYNNNIEILPENIGNLTTLQKLHFACNKIARIPNSIGQLYNLTTLAMFNCPLVYLPDSLSNLTKLTKLHVFPTFLTFKENKEHLNVSYILAKYYSHVGNEEQMIKYYAIELESGKYSVGIINIMLKYYKKINNPEYVIKYITYAIINDIKFVIDDEYKEYIQTIPELTTYLENFIIKLILERINIGLAYFLYKKFNIRVPKCDGVVISEVISFIQLHDNKMTFAKLEDCPICYKTAHLIPFDCFGHYYCTDCMFDYVYTTKKCPQCQIKPSKVNNKKRRRNESSSSDDDNEEEEDDNNDN